MPFLDTYRAQVALLVRVLPFVAEERAFALKGGTAINLFLRDMPRLSVDIDLTYLPVEDRARSLAAIDAAMARISQRITDSVPGARVMPSRLHAEKTSTKLIVRADNAHPRPAGLRLRPRAEGRHARRRRRVRLCGNPGDFLR